MLVTIKPAGRIKMRPEDFLVQEVVNGKVTQPFFETRITGAVGEFTSFVLTKRAISGERACVEVARQLGISREAITDYGMKDAQAITAQSIVIEGKFDPSFQHDQIWLRQIGLAKGRLRHGGHDGNRFKILVETNAAQPQKGYRFLNLFGPQRFGDGRVDIGRHLLEGDFEKALEQIQGSMNWQKLQSIASDYGLDFDEALVHPEFKFELGFKVNQWTSWLWNQLAPIVSEVSLQTWSLQTAEQYNEWWDPVELDAELYKLLHVFHRPVMSEARNIQIVRRADGIEHNFTLRSGSYATVYLSTLYDLEDVSRARY